MMISVVVLPATRRLPQVEELSFRKLETDFVKGLEGSKHLPDLFY
jgi:hypothetical protein